MNFANAHLEHAASSRQPNAIIARVAIGALALALWLAVAWLTIISIPRGERLFGEFHMQVPMLTELVVRFGRFAVPAIAILTLVMCLKVRKRWAWLWFLLVLPALLACAVFVSLYFPITRLVACLGWTKGWWEFF